MAIDNYTPEQIEEILQAFFEVAGTRQYIGARYVPIFGRGRGTPIEWDNSDAYEPLSIVYYQGDTYTSRRYVPAGIPIDNQDYWVITGRYNAQVEQYRQEVLGFSDRIDMLQQTMEDDYVPFPDSVHHPKYGTLGQVLTTLADGETLWSDPVTVDADIAEPLIDAWLDEHPEATTTVQDGAITTPKLADGAVTTAKIGSKQITDAKIADNTISNTKLVSTGVRAIANPARLLELDGLTYSTGFLQSNGTPSSNDDYRYVNEYIDTWKGDVFVFTCGKNSTQNPWLKICVYYADGTHSTRMDPQIVNEDDYFYYFIWKNTYTLGTAPYLIRPTFRVDTTGDDWFFSVARYPRLNLIERNDRLYRDGMAIADISNEIIELEYNYTFISTGVDGTTLTLNEAFNVEYSSHIIECSAGDNFCITGSSGSSAGARVWCFLDSSNTILSGASIDIHPYYKNQNITAPENATKLLVVFYTKYYYRLVRGYISDVVHPGTILSSTDSRNHYIVTGDGVSTLDPTPIYFRGYTWAIYPCTAGDTFTLFAKGGDSGRAWAFVSQNDNILSRARSNEACNGTIITAPAYARYLVVNSETEQLRCCKNGFGALSGSAQAATIPTPQICDLPKDVMAMPTVENLSQVEETYGTAVAKTAIYKNGEWFLVTYGQNVDGTGTDIPLIGGSGCLEMVYKRFRYAGGVVSDVQYGRIAKIGDSYTDYNGNTAIMTGGCGLPSGIGALQYFTTPYTVDNGDESYDFGGYHDYGFTPCCCSVNLASDGTVTFGTIQELKLVVNGSSGKFDLRRIDPAYQNAYTYVTTAPPTKRGSTWYWAQVVTMGIAILTSTDGITWNVGTIINTPYQPKCEIVISSNSSNQLLLGIRTNNNSLYMTNTLYLMLVNISKYATMSEYQIPFVESRTQIVQNGNEWLLFNPTNDKSIVDVIKITKYGNVLRFWRWFTIYVKPTWYVTCYQPSVETLNFTNMYLAGGNSSAGSTAGLSFMHLSFDGTEPHSPLSIAPTVI